MSLVNQFLTQIRQFVRKQNGAELKSWLQVEPGSPKQYHDLAAELRSRYASASSIEQRLDTCLPQDDDVPDGQATVWPGLIAFL
jgi:hypothetical protein